MEILASDVTLDREERKSQHNLTIIITNLWEDLLHYSSEVGGEAPHALVNPLHGEAGLTEPRYPGLHTRGVAVHMKVEMRNKDGANTETTFGSLYSLVVRRTWWCV